MPHPNNPNASALAILERRKNVAARYVRGATQWEIARAFEVDQKTISNDLAAIRKEWLASAVRDMNEIKARELAKIDAAEAEAWKAWTKSQENAEILRARIRDGASETEKVSKGQAGDPRFLDIVLKCIKQRCEILGVLAPKDPLADGVKIVVVELPKPTPLVEVSVNESGTGENGRGHPLLPS